MKQNHHQSRQVLACLSCALRLFVFGFGFFGIIGAVLAAAMPVLAQTSTEEAYVIKDDRVIDLRSGVEWLRCTVGQQFDEGVCTGEVLRLTQDEAAEAIKVANRELGGIWRLPTRKELEFLICKSCPSPKINKSVFPGTVSEPYWTGERNWISPKNVWSVNFMTGHSYGRFFPYQRLAVRLVRTR